jgi:hypothetical protein
VGYSREKDKIEEESGGKRESVNGVRRKRNEEKTILRVR